MTKPFVFTLMPFDTAFDDIYKLGIKATCEELDAYCERVDEQQFQENILERIYNQINKADIIISDMTGRNPNVFYETGYAHALNKKVILLTQKTEDIPFDLKHYPHIIYDGKILKLQEELKKRLDWLIKNPAKNELPNESAIEIYIDGKKLGDNTNLEKSGSFDETYHGGRNGIKLAFAILNNSNTTYDSEFRIGIITDKDFTFNTEMQTIKRIQIGETQFIHISQPYNEIFPQSWVTFEITLLNERYEKLGGKTLPFIVRLFSEIGIKDFQLYLHFKEDERTTGW